MELLDNPTNVGEQFVKRCNDWITRHRPVDWEDYINGKAELTWMLKFTVFGRWHKARFKTQVVDGSFNADWTPWSAWYEFDSETGEGGSNDDRLVFISYVGRVETPKGFVPARIGLGLSADLFSLVARPLCPLLDHQFNVLPPVFGERKIAILNVPAPSFNYRCDANIQSGTEVVERVAEDGADLNWWHFIERDFKAKVPSLEVRFLRNAVVVSTEEAVNEEVHLSDVRLRAL